MFDLVELDQAETALRALASGETPPLARASEPASADQPKGDISRCPFHNGAMSLESLAA